MAAIEDGASDHLDLMIGTTRHEQTRIIHMLGSTPDLLCPDVRSIKRRFAPMFGDRVDALVDELAGSSGAASASELYVELATDQWMRIPAVRFAEARVARGGTATFMYRFDWETSMGPGFLRATHGLDVPFVFGNVAVAKATRSGEGRDDLVDAMTHAWASFVHDGDPSRRELAWPEYDTSARSTMLLDAECEVAHDPDGSTRRVWEAVASSELARLDMSPPG
jgi:para-nitrobenzyl esterase